MQNVKMVWHAVSRQAERCRGAFKGLATHAVDLADPARRSDVAIHFKGFSAFPSSRLDSQRDFEPIGIVHVDFR